jgi:hypothetical protein
MALTNPVNLDSLPSLMEQNNTYHAEHFRRLLQVALKGQSGVIGGAISAQPTPGMSVAVAAFTVAVAGSQDTLHQGEYLCESFSAKNVTIPAASQANDRIDRILVGVFDPQYLGGQPGGQIGVLPGAPASNPVPTPIPTDGTYFELGQIRVRANTSSILQTDVIFTTVGLQPTISGPLLPNYGGFVGQTRDLGLYNPGPPASFLARTGDRVQDFLGALWVCTAGGNPGTWLPIGAMNKFADVTVTAPTQAINFTNIPQGFRHLLLITSSVQCNSTGSVNVMGQFNNDTASNYAAASYGGGSNGSWSGTGNTVMPALIVGVAAVPASPLDYGSGVAFVLDYTQPRTRFGVWEGDVRDDSDIVVRVNGGDWKTVGNPITTFHVFAQVANVSITAGRFELYGIA